ncbi:hypothetical protein [Sorangium sp. So ce388]|uniref:hypothetical protein n=1 Tax=Sorangium sp. So ce388 TaxID=3133309 RepID=UPI003F5B65A8
MSNEMDADEQSVWCYVFLGRMMRSGSDTDAARVADKSVAALRRIELTKAAAKVIEDRVIHPGMDSIPVCSRDR